MRFYTWTTNIDEKRLFRLLESAESHNIKIEYLGSDLNMFHMIDKMNLLYKKLCTLDDNEIVCAVDAVDVFFCADKKVIEERFLLLNCDCLISAERAYSHQYKRCKKYYDEIDVKSPYKYINAGSFMGYAGALRKLLAPTFATRYLPKIFTKIRSVKKKLKLDKWSTPYYFDQKHMGKYIIKNPDNLNIKPDHHTNIFWCTAFEWEDIDDHFRVEGGRMINSHTNNAPLIIHVPGTGTWMKVLERLYEKQRSLRLQS